MNPDDPLNVASLERRLQERWSPEASEGRRRQILQAVSVELAAFPRRSSRGSFLSFAATMAAMLLIGLNLSLGAPTATLPDPHPIASRQTLDDASAIEQLSPDLSRANAIGLLLLCRAGEHLNSFPEIYSRPRPVYAGASTTVPERTLP